MYLVKSRRMRWVGCVALMEDRIGAIKDFGEQTRGKETTWKTQASMKDSIKMDLKEVGWWGMDWIDLAQDRDKWLV
jgi:hypothetical protein